MWAEIAVMLYAFHPKPVKHRKSRGVLIQPNIANPGLLYESVSLLILDVLFLYSEAD
jgi:hypothetical protein